MYLSALGGPGSNISTLQFGITRQANSISLPNPVLAPSSFPAQSQPASCQGSRNFLTIRSQGVGYSHFVVASWREAPREGTFVIPPPKPGAQRTPGKKLAKTKGARERRKVRRMSAHARDSRRLCVLPARLTALGSAVCLGVPDFPHSASPVQVPCLELNRST